MTTRTRPRDAVDALATLGEPTRRRLYEYVVRRGDAVGRDEAAAQLGITRALAAFHLDRLERAGLLSAEYRRLTGRTGPGAGRPAKLYRRAAGELDASVPPRRYAFAAELMAGALSGRRATAAHRELMRSAREAGVAAARETGSASPGAPAQDRAAGPDAAATAPLERAGFEPTVQDDGTVVLRNCPYAALIPEHRDVVCAMNLAYAEGFLEAARDTIAPSGPELVARLEPAEGRCCVLLKPASAVPVA
jgi:predicted ArsR family transcriptional regulator